MRTWLQPDPQSVTLGSQKEVPKSDRFDFFRVLGPQVPQEGPKDPKCPQKVHFGAILDKFGSPPGSLGVKMMPKVEQNEL